LPVTLIQLERRNSTEKELLQIFAVKKSEEEFFLMDAYLKFNMNFYKVGC
jgi:hypothetical protein